VAATPETLSIMAARYGEHFTATREPLTYGKSLTRDGVTVRLAPAGHVLGSAQAVISWNGMTIVVSGDYKRRRDPTCPPFEPQRCDVFVSEATFGLPVFVHPPDSEEIAKLLQSVRQFPDRTHLVGAYALGKAQRLIRLLREAGYGDTLYMHGALASMNVLYERHGIELGPLAAATTDKSERLPGKIVLAPPSAIADKWSRRFAEPLPVFASGWMRVRARARQRHVELPLIISDHADWNELIQTFTEIRPEQLWITHGAEEALLRWSALNGIDARALSLVGYDEDEGEA
jgi:putative mRNA 3-end processing factor